MDVEVPLSEQTVAQVNKYLEIHCRCFKIMFGILHFHVNVGASKLRWVMILPTGLLLSAEIYQQSMEIVPWLKTFSPLG